MAYAWLAGFPILTAITAALSLPVIGVGAGALARAMMPALAASSAMLLVVLGIDALLPPMPVLLRLAILVSAGAAAYCGFLLAFARRVVDEMLGMVKRRRPAAAAL